MSDTRCQYLCPQETDQRVNNLCLDGSGHCTGVNVRYSVSTDLNVFPGSIKSALKETQQPKTEGFDLQIGEF